MKKVKVNIKSRTFEMRIEYFKKRWVNNSYLGSKNFNLMPVIMKRKIFCIEGNRITKEIKKKIQIWLFPIFF
jgi:hypothetical protein